MLRRSSWCSGTTSLRRKMCGRESLMINRDIRSEILDTAEDGRLRVDYGRFHETVQD
jgi:hypothetical protein